MSGLLGGVFGGEAGAVAVASETKQRQDEVTRKSNRDNKRKPPPQNLLVDLKSIRAQVPGFTVFSGDLGDK